MPGLIIFNNHDGDQNWYVIRDKEFKTISDYHPTRIMWPGRKQFDLGKFHGFVRSKIFNYKTGEKTSCVLKSFHTRDFHTEKVDLNYINNIITLPSI